jgi:hypothetical protein
VILSRAKLGSSIELIVRSLFDHRMSMVSTRSGAMTWRYSGSSSSGP